MRLVIATLKTWNIEKAAEFQKKNPKMDVKVITEKKSLTNEMLSKYKPDYIFFPHWSYIIPEEIFKNYNCIVFHMTDLPYGRGGSPLQNLIVRGHKETKISAIKVVEGLDEGPIYMKYPLTLGGKASDIFIRAAGIIFDKMIPEIISSNIQPKEQVGNPEVFKRRKPEQSELKNTDSLESIYDYIRMVDGEGYPKAFIDFGNYRLEFDSAEYENGRLKARVEFIKRIDN